MTAARLRHRSDFAALRHARRERCGPLTVRSLVIDDDAPAAVGFAIGRVVGNAVVRNRLRRRLRVWCAEMPLAPGGRYLVIAHPGAGDLTFRELGARLTPLFARLGTERA